jgi:hypothetical protein
MLRVVHAFIGHLYIFIWKVPAHLPCLLIYWIICCFSAYFWALYIFRILICQMNSWQQFLPICKLSLRSIVSFTVQKLLNLMQSCLSILAVIFWAIGVLFRKSLLMLLPWRVSTSLIPLLCSNFHVLHKDFNSVWLYFCTD